MPAPSLSDALSSLGRDWSAATRVPVAFDIASATPDVTREVSSDLLWIVREALHNIAAHAHAQQVQLRLSYQDGTLAVTVADDGQGFSFEGGLTALWADGRQGLAGMDERARLLGGSLEVRTWPEKGTRITVRVPVALPPAPLPPPAPKRRAALVLLAIAVVSVLITTVVLLWPASPTGLLNEPSVAPSSSGPPDTSPLSETSPSPSPSPTRSRATASPVVTSPAAIAPAGATPASPPCMVSYQIRTQWTPGFVADVLITNLSAAPIQNWRLEWTFTNGQQTGNHWNASLSQTGAAVTASHSGNIPRIDPGETVTFGFEGTWTGSNPKPAAFTLNGNPCGMA